MLPEITIYNYKCFRFIEVESGAMNVTVANINIAYSTFFNFAESGFVLGAWTRMFMRGNSFDELPANAIIAPNFSPTELVFAENDIEKIGFNSLGFIGKIQRYAPNHIKYMKNFYGQSCNCNISSWLSNVLYADSGTPFHTQSYCTLDEFFARCFNVPEQNMLVSKFLARVCNDENAIRCESYKIENEGTPEIKNPRFPHKKESELLSEREKKIITIVIVTVLGCFCTAALISFIKYSHRKGYFGIAKNFLLATLRSCKNFCCGVWTCGTSRDVDDSRDFCQFNTFEEYLERVHLNENRMDMMQETAIPNLYTEQEVVLEDKAVQTLPGELTKELLENLRDRLDDPNNYKEARATIEHLYELLKDEDTCHFNTPVHSYTEENIYEVPIVVTLPRLGRNKKPVVSVGTSTHWDELTPLSPYNRTTALVHEYIEPKDLKDMTAHLYAEINSNTEHHRGKQHAVSAAADVMPRGPYLKAVREKISTSPSTSQISSPTGRSISSVQDSTSSSDPIVNTASPEHISTIKSDKSVTSDGSGRMINRPLPKKPTTADPGEGPSGSR